MLDRLRKDVRAVLDRDPAARGRMEVLICYPGIHAVAIHRLAHRLWGRGFHLTARILAHFARWITGIEIHPGAKIGEGFFIDHGMGVVIGETAEIGDNVTLYHGVTLGGTSWNQGKRHPTLGNHVVVGAGAKVLGPITIGDHARIGSNSVVVKDVPPGATVVGIPGRLLLSKSKSGEHDLHFTAYGQDESLPDPVVKAIGCVLDQVHHLDNRLQRLEAGENLDEVEGGEPEPEEPPTDAPESTAHAAANDVVNDAHHPQHDEGGSLPDQTPASLSTIEQTASRTTDKGTGHEIDHQGTLRCHGHD
ncbi:MAG: serine O-acetyltransferase [Magnetococcales bacterium]|nr:serine O-acetyltransferase [Magnetococcales bacterium]